MRPQNTKELLDTLCAEIDSILAATDKLKKLPADVLLTQPAAKKWSVAQVLEHLNSYNRYYLPQIESAIAKANKTSVPNTFRSGWLGNYFTRSMYSEVVNKGQIANKMKAPKDHRPVAQLDTDAMLEEFMSGAARLKNLMQTNSVDLAEVKIPISIAKWMRIKLGDTYRFLVAHKVRHFLQVKNTLAAIEQ